VRTEGHRRALPECVLRVTFSDSLAIYMLSIAVDFDYHDLREREYPLLAARPWQSGCATLPASSRNSGFEFQVLYRRKG